VRIVKDLLRARTQDGMAVFMSTHTLAMAEEMADRVGIMVRGQLRFLGTVAELRAQVAIDATNLEHLYLELTSGGAAGPAGDGRGTGGRGTVSGSSLERSNVELEDQFVNMITSQRMYQASAKVVSSADESLQVLVNLI
jgi:flagellar basal body rod protein FlgG